MDHIPNFGDERQTQFCLYCGKSPDTREHVPSRIFLDQPYPQELHVVGACTDCNQKHSLDEEYVACAIECALRGSANSDAIQRRKIKRILETKPLLKARIGNSFVKIAAGLGLKIENERFQRVCIKLAQCHLLFNQNEPPLEEPSVIKFGTLEDLDGESKYALEQPVPLTILPEVGSRAMQRMLILENVAYMPWVEVQRDRYRFITPEVGVARMVFSEYLWCEVRWELYG